MRDLEIKQEIVNDYIRAGWLIKSVGNLKEYYLVGPSNSEIYPLLGYADLNAYSEFDSELINERKEANVLVRILRTFPEKTINCLEKTCEKVGKIKF